MIMMIMITIIMLIIIVIIIIIIIVMMMMIIFLCRNVTVDGGSQACDAMTADDIMTPLAALLKQVGLNCLGW